MTGIAVGDRDLLELYRQMRRMRAVEEAASKLFDEGKTVGRIYTGRGQEAISVGTASALSPHDVIAPLYRDLGALLVRGITLREVFCQYCGRDNSSTRGRDSGLHIHAHERGVMVNMISTLTSSLPVAVGLALSFRIRKEPRVAMTYFGDGSTSTGSAHEGLNFAAARKLPVVFVCENNQWALSTPNHKEFAVKSLVERAQGYGIPAVRVDGNDVEAVLAAARDAVQRTRSGEGPTFIEALTMRMWGHSVTDPGQYIPRQMLQEWAAKDPIDRTRKRLSERKLLDDAAETRLGQEIDAEIEEAIEFALSSPMPDPAHLGSGVFA